MIHLQSLDAPGSQGHQINVTFGETSFGTGLTHESPSSIAMENDQESAAPLGVNKWEMAKISTKLLDQSSACTPGFAALRRSMCKGIGSKDS